MVPSAFRTRPSPATTRCRSGEARSNSGEDLLGQKRGGHVALKQLGNDALPRDQVGERHVGHAHEPSGERIGKRMCAIRRDERGSLQCRLERARAGLDERRRGMPQERPGIAGHGQRDLVQSVVRERGRAR